MPHAEGNAAEELRDAIDGARREMENCGGADLRSIVAETAYDYWPQRAALARARERAIQQPSSKSALGAIGADERGELVAAIGRTQEALRGNSTEGELDLVAIAREGSREYWAERKRLQEHASTVGLDAAALAAMTQMLRDAERTLVPRRERRKPWRDVFYDAVAVAMPLMLVPPLLLSLAEGSFAVPTSGPRKTALAFADPSFRLTALLVVGLAGAWLFRALRHPETGRRFLQFGGALSVSILVAIASAAYIYGNRTTARMDRIQATLSSPLLLALEQSSDTNSVVIPTQIDRSMTVETKWLTASAAMLSAAAPGIDGEVRVLLRPESAAYSWVLNGREIPKGRLTVGEITAYDRHRGTITLKTGDETTTYRYPGELATDIVGTRVAAVVGADNAIGNIVDLGLSRSHSMSINNPAGTMPAQVQ